MSTKVQKWGNSLAVRIPDDVVEEAGFVQGKEVTVKNVRNTVVISPMTAKRRPTLDELVARIKPHQLHKAVDWGKPMGREIW
jgi:antitoxin MazE